MLLTEVLGLVREFFHSDAVGDLTSQKAMRKGQIKRLDGKDAVGQAKFVMSLFEIAA